MVFSAVSTESSFEVVGLIRVGDRNKTRAKQATAMLRYTILTQFDLK